MRRKHHADTDSLIPPWPLAFVIHFTSICLLSAVCYNHRKNAKAMPLAAMLCSVLCCVTIIQKQMTHALKRFALLISFTVHILHTWNVITYNVSKNPLNKKMKCCLGISCLPVT